VLNLVGMGAEVGGGPRCERPRGGQFSPRFRAASPGSPGRRRLAPAADSSLPEPDSAHARPIRPCL